MSPRILLIDGWVTKLKTDTIISSIYSDSWKYTSSLIRCLFLNLFHPAIFITKPGPIYWIKNEHTKAPLTNWIYPPFFLYSFLSKHFSSFFFSLLFFFISPNGTRLIIIRESQQFSHLTCFSKLLQNICLPSSSKFTLCLCGHQLL